MLLLSLNNTRVLSSLTKIDPNTEFTDLDIGGTIFVFEANFSYKVNLEIHTSQAVGTDNQITLNGVDILNFSSQGIHYLNFSINPNTNESLGYRKTQGAQANSVLSYTVTPTKLNAQVSDQEIGRRVRGLLEMEAYKINRELQKIEKKEKAEKKRLEAEKKKEVKKNGKR